MSSGKQGSGLEDLQVLSLSAVIPCSQGRGGGRSASCARWGATGSMTARVISIERHWQSCQWHPEHARLGGGSRSPCDAKRLLIPAFDVIQNLYCDVHQFLAGAGGAAGADGLVVAFA